MDHSRCAQALCALGCKFIKPIDELGITATLLDETAQPIRTVALALVTRHARAEAGGEKLVARTTNLGRKE
jgi:hypothetical protein